jgi:AcrR family transcriptional regulator
MAELNELIPREKLEGLSRRERKKQETRWRIFNAAMELMEKKAFDSVTIEDICAAADVSNPLFFHHFSNKAALISTYINCRRDEVAQKLAAVPDASATEQLDIINSHLFKSAKVSVAFTPQLLAEMFNTKSLDFEHVDTGLTGILAQIIKKGQKAGEFSKHWHHEIAAVSLIGAWLLLPLAAQEAKFPKGHGDEALNLIKAGLKTPP